VRRNRVNTESKDTKYDKRRNKIKIKIWKINESRAKEC
jgi:hypothetical protein